MNVQIKSVVGGWSWALRTEEGFEYVGTSQGWREMFETIRHMAHNSVTLQPGEYSAITRVDSTL